MEDEEDFNNLPFIDLSEFIDTPKVEEVEAPSVMPETAVEDDFSSIPFMDLENLQEPAEVSQAPTEKPKSLTQTDVAVTPEYYEPVRDYMVNRMGRQYESMKPEEVVNDFVTHMRWVNTNEINTLGEARHILDLEDEKKARYGEAYKVYNQLGSFLTNDGAGGALEGAFDYTAAILTSPSTWLGGMIGRTVGGIGAKGAKIAATKAMATAAEKAVTKTAGKAAGVVARKEVVNAAAKRSAMVTVTTAGAVDAGTAMLADGVYQNIMKETGVQDDYSLLQGGIAALSGAVGAGIAYIPERSRAVSALADTGDKIVKARKLRAENAKKAIQADVKTAITRLTQDWEKMAAQGQAMDPNIFIRDSAVDWFFDLENENSFVRILQKNGAELDLKSEGTLSRQMVEYVTGLPDDFKESVTEALKPMGIKFGEMIDIFAGVMQKAGQDQSKASLAKRFLQDYADVTVAKRRAAENTLAGEMAEEGLEETSPQVLRYAASVWKRALVSHPATTMLNIKGWMFTMSGRTLAELMHGGTLGTVGLAKKMMNISSADRNLAQSAALFKSQWFMAKTMMDPHTSVEAFSQLLSRAPKKYQKDALSSFFGGVGDEKPAMFGLSENGMIVRNIEKALDAAADISFVRVQDIYTKTFSGLKELDKLSRTELGEGLEDIINKGRSGEITDDMWERVIDSTLKDTLSKNYTRGKDVLSQLAKVVETISNAPGLGFIVPFGRFLNNTVAFTMAYSPLALVGIAPKIFKEGFTMDLTDKVMRAAVGTTALAMLTTKEGEKQAQGLQWFEERNQDGTIQNVQSLFPMSLYNLVGRMIHLHNSGDGIPEDMWQELGKQVGPLAGVQGLTDIGVVTETIKYLSDIQGDEDEKLEFMKLVGYAAASVSGTVLSGFTRPLDPINDITGMILDNVGVVNQVSVDRKQAEGMDAILQQFSRYTDTFFNVLLGEDTTGDGKLYGAPLQSATEREAVKDPNPISRLLGETIESRRSNVDTVLGMVNIPPFKFNSFTGNAQYDAFVNDKIYPILERKSTALLRGGMFRKAPTNQQRAMVNRMLEDAREELKEAVRLGYVGTTNNLLLQERRDFLSQPEDLRVAAKKALGIRVEDRKLTLYQLEALKYWMEVEQGFQRGFVD